MFFSSGLFLFYFLPVFLLLYFIADKRYRNYIALAGSIIFYFWGAPLFTFVVLASIVGDFYLAKFIHNSLGLKRKSILIFAVALNIAILLCFQYANFFADNIYTMFGKTGFTGIKWLKLFIPLGISFITFHKISYLIDVYREVNPPMKKLGNYALFIMFFPQLISGPIIRANELSDQIEDNSQLYTIDNKLLGFVRFVIGLAKKVLIADVLGLQVDKIFALTGTGLTTPLAWIGIIGYAFQIYFDFSGYSDMAIGLARIMGFKFPENFNNPYIAQSITEFWRRWHMTLSSWLRDYLFMPLSVRMRNWKFIGLSLSLLITFTLCGMWHKPGWTFIIWGAYYGVLLIVDRLFLLKILNKVGRIPSIIVTFFLTLMGWVFFRSENLHQVKHYFKELFVFDLRHSDIVITNDFWTILIIAAICTFLAVFKFIGHLQHDIYEKTYNTKRLIIMGSITVILFIISVGSMLGSGINPFIYFRF